MIQTRDEGLHELTETGRSPLMKVGVGAAFAVLVCVRLAMTLGPAGLPLIDEAIASSEPPPAPQQLRIQEAPVLPDADVRKVLCVETIEETEDGSVALIIGTRTVGDAPLPLGLHAGEGPPQHPARPDGTVLLGL